MVSGLIRMALPARTTDLSDLRPITRMYREGDGVPNNPTLATVIVKGAVAKGQGGDALMALLAQNRWGGNWQYTVFDYHHYHPNAHETLIVASGHAEIQLGGPTGDVVGVNEGDVLVLPAGTGHCRLAGSQDFSVCGGYPRGQENYETVRAGTMPIEDALTQIVRVPTPNVCPIFAEIGPLMTAWGG